MQAILIINPVSGDAEPNSAKLPDILRLLAPAPFEVIVRETTLETTAGDLAQAALAEGHTIVLVGGGDGTVSEVAAALVNQPATLGVIPIGTFNNMARSFEIAPELETSCGIIVAGHTKEVDVGLANEKTTFFEAAGSGLDATLFPVGEELKSGQWSRIFSLVKLAVQFKRRTFSIRMTTNDTAARSLRRRALLVVVANGPYYGGGFTVAHDASLTDGLLTVCIYRKFSKWELMKHFYSISRGKRKYSPNVETYHAAEVEIKTRRRVPVHIDGKPSGTTPFTFCTLGGALKIFAPERPLTEDEDVDPPIPLPGSGENEKSSNKDKKVS